MTLRELSRRCGVSKTHLANVETGLRRADPDLVDRILEGLGATASFRILPRSTADPTEPAVGHGNARGTGDLVHARCVTTLERMEARRRRATCVEQALWVQGRPGWIDLMAFDAATGRLVVVEVKTQLRDIGGLLRQLELYERGCREAARSRGWPVREVVIGVAVLLTEENELQIAANRIQLAGQVPVRGRRAALAILGDKQVDGRCLLMVDPLQRGARAVTRSVIDGRRTPAPYRDYAAVAQLLEADARLRMTLCPHTRGRQGLE